MNDLERVERCNLCTGRGYKSEARKSGKGFYARTCRRCGGCGYVPTGTSNSDPYARKDGKGTR